MARSIWKHNYTGKVLPFVTKKKNKDKKTWEITYSRKILITPNFIGYSFNVYNGSKFSLIKVSEDMVQHKLGEFCTTRKRFIPKQKKGILMKKR